MNSIHLQADTMLILLRNRRLHPQHRARHLKDARPPLLYYPEDNTKAPPAPMPPGSQQNSHARADEGENVV